MWLHTPHAGKDGSYGTSLERYKALDPASDIILAFRQNGRLLTPDHGYPLRIIIPGWWNPVTQACRACLEIGSRNACSMT